MRVRATILAMTVGLGVVASGCGDADSGSGGETTSMTATGMATGPAVSFVAPADGSEVTGDVVAQVEVSDFTISADDVGKTPMDGVGHLHFSMDDGKYDQPKYSGANGELAVTLNTDGKYSPSVMPSITYTGLPKGEHTLKVFLAGNTHLDVGPVAETTFVVK